VHAALLCTYTHTRAQVVSVSASSSMLLVGLASGAIQRYSLPRVALDARYELKATCPNTLKLNCDSTMAAVKDRTTLLNYVIHPSTNKLNSKHFLSYDDN